MTRGITRDLLAHPVRGIRCGGSAGVDMMHVARGRLDAYFEALPRCEDVKRMGGTGICNWLINHPTMTHSDWIFAEAKFEFFFSGLYHMRLVA